MEALPGQQIPGSLFMVYQGIRETAIQENLKERCSKSDGGENEDFVFIWMMMIYDI